MRRRLTDLGSAIVTAGSLMATPALGQKPALRPDVAGVEAAVTSDHPLASAAGAEVLRHGGNAVDAAITMAAVLSVVRPHMNGVGGDAFLIIRDGRTGTIDALNGSGRAGSKATPAFFADRKLTAIPGTGILSVSVPGAVRAWGDALAKHGTITLARALEPAIRYARRGFPVSPRLAEDIAAEQKKVAQDTALARIFLPNGAPPPVGSLFREPELAATLEAIAAQGPDALYRGAIAQKVAAFMDREGGLVTAADLARHTSTWTEPIRSTFLGETVLAFPPNTQGVTLLEQLNIAELMNLKALGYNSADYVQTLVEGAKLAYADRDSFVADPAFSNVPVERLISKAHAQELARVLRDRLRAEMPAPDAPRDGESDTVYLAVVDKDGNAVSMIESNFASFGSGRMVPGTGIILHNRGSLYSLEAGHPNIVAPGKRPFHTLCPAMVLHPDGTLHIVLGTPGGDGQTQTLVQVLQNIMVFGMTPQLAIEAPRFRWYGRRLGVEPGVPAATRETLVKRGMTVNVQEPNEEFGGAQAIVVWPSGVRMAGADPRREAYAIAW